MRKPVKMNTIRDVRIRDIGALLMFMLVLVPALVAKIFIRGLWIISDCEHEARDNGIALFKWIRANTSQPIIFALHKSSKDYPEASAAGRVVSHGSLAHWFYYIVADKKIGSQKAMGPNAAVCNLLEIKLHIWRSKRYFLQHGITKDDLAWLYNKNCRFKLFVCGAKPEYDYVAARYGYPEGAVQYLGLARFDNLHGATTDNTVVAMPTWRKYLLKSDIPFTETAYFKAWNGLLNSPRLAEILNRHDMRLLFYPHRNMQRLIDCFTTSSESVTIARADSYDIRTLIKSGAAIITDYSSVFFDFAYMRKPVLLYQFDRAEFREMQYDKGYFDYDDNVISKSVLTEEELLNSLEKTLSEGLSATAAEEFFPLYDQNNCERNYHAIKQN